jgi:anhydro-N-acetylmuramic acid kinase
MLADGYFTQLPPKTTGRERFGEQFLAKHAAIAALPLEDGAATLAELTAASIAQAIDTAGFAEARIIVSGGGAHNKSILARLAARLPRARVETSDVMGLPVDAKEAIAFAILGYETLRGRAANLPSVTGARHAAVLGAIVPQRLSELLAQIERESLA